GEHRAHQRLLDQEAPERAAMAAVVDRLDQRLTHSCCSADHTVEPGMVDHLHDRAYAASLVAHQPRPGVLELHFGGRVASVAELVLQPLQVEAIALPFRRPARQEKTGEPARGLREYEERVAGRRRAEPLVPGE